jgi:hypothetical protein
MKQESPSVFFLTSSLRRCSREEKHQVRVLGAARPDLLAVHDIFAALAAGEGAQGRRVRAAGRLRDPKGLEAEFASRDLRQIFSLLLLPAVPQDRAHRVHLGMAGAAIAAFRLNGFQDGRRRRDSETRASIFLGDQHREIAGLG